MKWFSNDCAHHRQKICLQAGGVLPEAEQVEVESHLAACADCRNYRDEMKSVAAPLANWEKHFARVTPSQAQQMRWEKAIKAVGKTKPTHSVSPGLVLRILWSELIWPSRRIWAGLAAAWVVIVVVNVHDASNTELASRTSTPTSPAVLMALREPELWFNEFAEPHEARDTDRPKKAVPLPRSERHNELFQA